MIRKGIIFLLTLAAVGTGALELVSYCRPWVWNADPVQRWYYVELQEGKLKGRYSYPLRILPKPSMRESSWSSLGLAFEYKSYARVVPMSEAAGLVDSGRAIRFHNSAVLMCRVFTVQIPFCAPFGLFAIYPLFAIIRGPLRRWHRRKHGLCVNCTYNLTGNLSGVCPECGREIPN